MGRTYEDVDSDYDLAALGVPFLRVEAAPTRPRLGWWKSWRSGHIANYHIERNEGPAVIMLDRSQRWITSNAYDLDYDPTRVPPFSRDDHGN